MAKLVPALFWLLIWAALSLFCHLEERLLPDFFSTLTAVWGLVSDNSFRTNLALTLLRVLPGIVISTAFGIPIGLAFATSRILRNVAEPLFSFVRGVPVATLFPAAIILFGIGDTARLVLTIYVALPILVVATTTGAMERPENKTRRDYLRLHQRRLASWHFPLCLVWDALPAILSGLKIAIALSLVVVIVSEMFFVGGSGAGWYIWDQYQSFNLSKMYAAIFLVGLVSFWMSVLLDTAQQRMVRQ
ncbi:MAG TPA: hypothetical protein VF548_06790 [Allosphingosinicella sp.]|jgi:ABC-type nitrate/sulfonate/bicarbonate transport system permease component